MNAELENPTQGVCEPISWLRLERYHLGELPVVEERPVAHHLAECARCRSCLDSIRNDDRGDLPALPSVAEPMSPARASRSTFAPDRRWVGVFGLAASALVALVVLVVQRPQHASVPSRVLHGKGGDVALELVREHGGSIAFAPEVFVTGDRFKALVTCPAPTRLFVDLVVFQEGVASFPGEPMPITCGNRVPYVPAFRIVGSSPATVCIVLADASAPPRTAASPVELAGQAACAVLAPARE
jgi:hypothetical protein